MLLKTLTFVVFAVLASLSVAKNPPDSGSWIECDKSLPIIVESRTNPAVTMAYADWVSRAKRDLSTHKTNSGGRDSALVPLIDELLGLPNIPPESMATIKGQINEIKLFGQDVDRERPNHVFVSD